MIIHNKYLTSLIAKVCILGWRQLLEKDYIVSEKNQIELNSIDRSIDNYILNHKIDENEFESLFDKVYDREFKKFQREYNKNLKFK